MDFTLTPNQARIVGALMEKEFTTPEYCPLTLNSLKAACNQKSNRDPVMTLDDKSLIRGLDELRQIGLVYEKSTPGGRTFKYASRVMETFDLKLPEAVILCVALLRGPQTLGEFKTRTSRMYRFDSIDAVADSLVALTKRDDEPLMIQLPKRPGNRENRNAHLLCGEIVINDDPSPTPEPARIEVMKENERIATLERQIETLTTELIELRDAFETFRKEFE